MATTLYQSTSKARKILLVILVLAVLFLLFDNLQGLFTGTAPTGPVRQNRFYMEIDRSLGEITIPKITAISFKGTPTFQLESVHGAYPDIAYVYKVDQPRETLLSFERAKNTVLQLGFDPNKSTNEGSIYKWIKDQGTKVIEYDRQKQTWKLTTNYALNEDAVRNKATQTNAEEYKPRALSLLSKIGFAPTGITESLVDTKFVALGLNETFVDSSQTAELNYAAVNVFKNLDFADLKPSGQRPALNKGEVLPEEISGYVYKSDPRFGQFKMIGSNQLKDITRDLYELSYTDYEYSSTKGSYLIVSADEAWNNISRGSGSLVFMQPQNSNYFGDYKDLEISRFVADARQTKVGYFEPETWDGFVYPIYIFTGRAELKDGRLAKFIYFIDAIKRTN